MTTHEDRLVVLAGECGGGSCPTVYATEHETVVVQGPPINGDSAGVQVPDGERLVEIPVAILLAAADKIRDQGRPTAG